MEDEVGGLCYAGRSQCDFVMDKCQKPSPVVIRCRIFYSLHVFSCLVGGGTKFGSKRITHT